MEKINGILIVALLTSIMPLAFMIHQYNINNFDTVSSQDNFKVQTPFGCLKTDNTMEDGIKVHNFQEKLLNICIPSC